MTACNHAVLVQLLSTLNKCDQTIASGQSPSEHVPPILARFHTTITSQYVALLSMYQLNSATPMIYQYVKAMKTFIDNNGGLQGMDCFICTTVGLDPTQAHMITSADPLIAAVASIWASFVDAMGLVCQQATMFAEALSSTSSCLQESTRVEMLQPAKMNRALSNIATVFLAADAIARSTSTENAIEVTLGTITPGTTMSAEKSGAGVINFFHTLSEQSPDSIDDMIRSLPQYMSAYTNVMDMMGDGTAAGIDFEKLQGMAAHLPNMLE